MRFNLKLLNILVTPKLVKNIITNIDISKTLGLHFISVAVLNSCYFELSYISVELFQYTFDRIMFDTFI